MLEPSRGPVPSASTAGRAIERSQKAAPREEPTHIVRACQHTCHLRDFVVIATTAIAAIVQLRHMRGSNQITALNELRETMETPEYQDAQQFVMTELSVKLSDPAFRRQIFDRSAGTPDTRPMIAKVNRIGNFFETLGALVKAEMIDRDLALDVLSGNVARAW